MADTIADLGVIEGAWVDVYAGTSIAVGTAVTVTNKGSYPVSLAIKATEPSDDTIGYPLYVGPSSTASCVVEAGASGLWAYGLGGDSRLLVQE